ncbi:cytochrome c oxidase subunit 3 [Bradyrhizobium sp. ARR65]|uniref:cytochrome c oxidase subunit 3 n=1 Tax=Bradyrhizobium sp. ARR65 TaxID=1040989 RepID=UPI000464CA8F|nr:cytochrome c oxidase subunit 3 [Bradyrhizobium sp. ARR65]
MSGSARLAPEVQYATLEQQGDTAQLGMWVFLVNETIFFGALIFAYFLYRMTYPHEFAAAARDTVLWCGSLNFVLLLTSSLTMVLAINAAAQDENPRRMMIWLVVTVALGSAFLVVKGYEYYLDYQDKVVPVVHFESKPGEGSAGELFWMFYWVGTGLHAVHLTVGIALVLYMLLWRIRRGEIGPTYYAPLEVVGIYWSFVDTVWLFLFPSIYLLGRS